MRRMYTDNKVGVGVVDQKDAALMTQHGSKRTPWHRVHDAYLNTAATEPLTLSNVADQSSRHMSRQGRSKVAIVDALRE